MSDDSDDENLEVDRNREASEAERRHSRASEQETREGQKEKQAQEKENERDCRKSWYAGAYSGRGDKGASHKVVLGASITLCACIRNNNHSL